MKAIVFPGQGSQHRGMGSEVFGLYPDLVAEANAVLGYNLADVCFNNPNGMLDKTEVTQPAVYVVSSLQYRQLMEGEARPDFVAGHSLGEYAALAAAGVFSFAAGLHIVQRRGELMGAAYGGGLVAIIGLGRQEVEQVLALDDVAGVEIANVNSHEQVVVGGRKDRLQRVLEVCAERSVRAVPLRVSGAFHTSEMRTASQKFADVLKTIEFHAPQIPVLANVSGDVHELDGLADRLVQQMVQPVLWCECVQTMLNAGVTEFVEIGKTQVLTPLIQSIRSDVARAPLATVSRLAPTAKVPEAATPSGHEVERFTEHFRCVRPIVAGALGHGMSGARLVESLATSGVLGFLDTDGMGLDEIDYALGTLTANKGIQNRFGVSVCACAGDPNRDAPLIELLIKHEVGCVEARGYAQPSAALVRYRNANRNNRVLARVYTMEALAAFLRGSPASTKASMLPAPTVSPWAQAICIDLRAWRSRRGGDFTLLLDAVAWRDAHRRSKANEPFFVGASGAAESPGSIASLLEISDFALVGSLYLLAREAGLDDAAKGVLASGGCYRNLPDWHLPELETRSWSIARSDAFCHVSERLYEIYLDGHADPDEWERLASALPTPFAGRIRELGSELFRTESIEQFRARLRAAGRSCLFPGIVACDAPIAGLRRKLSTASEPLRELPPAAELSEFLYPLSPNRKCNMEDRHV